MAKEQVKVVQDAEIVQEDQVPRCEITVGIDMKGNVYYRIGGPDQSLITIEGLLKYANREMDRLWGRTLEASSKAAQQE